MNLQSTLLYYKRKIEREINYRNENGEDAVLTEEFKAFLQHVDKVAEMLRVETRGKEAEGSKSNAPKSY